jgi:hypothetical protein
MLTKEIIPALQGAVPATITTCSLDGIPNTTILSQVWYVDSETVALSFQFFNKTHRNIRENPRVYAKVINPLDFVAWGMDLEYVRSDTEGPVFDEMEIQLEVFASMTGMGDVLLHLKAADIYKVKSVSKHTEEWIDG